MTDGIDLAEEVARRLAKVRQALRIMVDMHGLPLCYWRDCRGAHDEAMCTCGQAQKRKLVQEALGF